MLAPLMLKKRCLWQLDVQLPDRKVRELFFDLLPAVEVYAVRVRCFHQHAHRVANHLLGCLLGTRRKAFDDPLSCTDGVLMTMKIVALHQLDELQQPLATAKV